MKYSKYGIIDWSGVKIIDWGKIPIAAMVCPYTDKICNDPDCRQDGCLEQREEDGEETERTNASPTRFNAA